MGLHFTWVNLICKVLTRIAVRCVKLRRDREPEEPVRDRQQAAGPALHPSTAPQYCTLVLHPSIALEYSNYWRALLTVLHRAVGT